MTPSEFDSFTKLEADLWSAANNLRANSKLTSSEYCMPVLGIIFTHGNFGSIDQTSIRSPRSPAAEADERGD